MVREDPGNAISVKLFGQEATDAMLNATLGT